MGVTAIIERRTLSIIAASSWRLDTNACVLFLL